MAPENSVPAPETNDIVQNELLSEPVLEAPPEPFYKKPTLIVGAVIIISIALAVGAYFYFNQKSSQPKTSSQNPTPTPNINAGLAKKLASKSEDSVIMKVGEENIYKKDLDTELAVYPKFVQEDQAAKILLDKMTDDSVILQGGRVEKIITLDETFFNSPKKDYSKRVKQIEKVKLTLAKNTSFISGGIVALWFTPAMIKDQTTYEQAKELAKEKMTKLQTAVKSGKMSLAKAADQIKNDSSWSKYDPAYKINAYTVFTVQPNQKITFDPDFDKALLKLGKGETSDLYLIKDTNPNTNQKVDSVYMFGQVYNANTSSNSINFDQWLNNYKKTYEVTYY